MKTARILVLVSILTLAGCASGGGSGSSSAGSSSAAASRSLAIPSDSPLAKVEMGMNDAAVRKVLGDPDEANAYMTGKQFIPFYFGTDTHRTDWMYRGKGRVVFSRNQYTAGLKVIEVIYNPSELQ